MQRYTLLLPIFLLFTVVSCGSGNNNPVNNVGLFGNWNIAMYATGSTTPTYAFGLAMSQEGNNYSGASITYTGSVAPPANMCINANSLTATATTTGSNYTMTITDATTNTTIRVTGAIPTDTTGVSGTYTNPSSSTCPESTGTMDMEPQ